MKLKKRQTVKSSYAKLEYPESDFIPYHGHWDANTVITKNKELIMVIKLDGYSFETADDEDVDMRKNVRNTLLKSISAGKYALWFHTVRRKQAVDVDGDFSDAFCQNLNNKWKDKHSSSEGFINELYISVVLKKDSASVAKIEDLLKSIAQKADKESWEYDLRSSHKDLVELTGRIVSTLKEYHPRLLGLRETEKGVFSEILEFFGILVNCGSYSPMRVPSSDAAKYLPTHRTYFGKKAMEIRGPTGKSKFAGAITIREYASYTSSGILDSFLQLPFEFVISQSFVFSNRQSAITSMSLHQRRMDSAGDKAISQANELTYAMDMAMSGGIGFGSHSLSIFVIESNLNRLESALSLCYGELVNCGINPARESMTLQASYWAMLPGNFSYISRGSTINTMNLAGFASLHNYPAGRKSGNHWGPAVTVFDTTSGTPFFFNFHIRDVGHTTIIGPTGAGKTVLMNFLMAQAQKFNCRTFFFDKDRGAEIFIRAIGGAYSVIKPGEQSKFNPLQLPDNHENRSFLSEWLKSLIIAAHNEPITPEESDRIYEAVEGNYKLPQKDRNLTNIAPFLGLEGPGTLAGRLKMWRKGEQYGNLFDNNEDHLDFSVSKSFGFEMGEVLKNKQIIGPVLLYLFHKISLSLDGTPTIIVLDEAWALIDNEVFAPRIKDWLKTMRKLNAMVIFATQSVEDASKSSISDTLVQQTATQIFLPNPKATKEYQETFMLTNREFSLIKTTNPGSRYFLVKQGDEVVVARIDLSGMEDLINVLSGRADTVLLLDKIRSEVGEKPEDWLPLFYERVKKIEKTE